MKGFLDLVKTNDPKCVNIETKDEEDRSENDDGLQVDTVVINMCKVSYKDTLPWRQPQLSYNSRLTKPPNSEIESVGGSKWPTCKSPLLLNSSFMDFDQKHINPRIIKCGCFPNNVFSFFNVVSYLNVSIFFYIVENCFGNQIKYILRLKNVGFSIFLCNHIESVVFSKFFEFLWGSLNHPLKLS